MALMLSIMAVMLHDMPGDTSPSGSLRNSHHRNGTCMSSYSCKAGCSHRHNNAAPRDHCAAARWRQPWRTKLQNFIYFVALVTAGTSPIRKGHGIEQRPTRIAGCSPLRTCRWKRLRRYRSDCEEVARVILGADMNMRLSFKPKQSS